MESIDQLAKKATCLRPQDRILLIEAILASLDKPDREIEKRWIDESEARYDAYKRGDLESVEWSDVRTVAHMHRDPEQFKDRVKQ